MISGANSILGILQKVVSPANSGAQAAKDEKDSKFSELAGKMKDEFSISPSLSKTLEFLNSQQIGGEDEGDLGDMDNLGSLKQKGQMLANILQMKINSFQTDLTKNLQGAGIDASQEIDLKDGGAEGILVSNDHPEAQKIMKLINDNKDLSDKFREIAKLSELVQGMQGLSGDAAAGTMNLNNIAAKYAREAKSTSADFVLKVNPGESSRVFE